MHPWNADVHSLLIQIAAEWLKGEYPKGIIKKEYSFLFEEKKPYRVDVVGSNGSESHAYECVVSAYPTLSKMVALKKTFHKVTVLTVSDIIRRAMEVVNTIGEQKQRIIELQDLVDSLHRQRSELNQEIERVKSINHVNYKAAIYWRKQARKK